jgi:hypothetical protein
MSNDSTRINFHPVNYQTREAQVAQEDDIYDLDLEMNSIAQPETVLGSASLIIIASLPATVAVHVGTIVNQLFQYLHNFLAPVNRGLMVWEVGLFL